MKRDPQNNHQLAGALEPLPLLFLFGGAGALPQAKPFAQKAPNHGTRWNVARCKFRLRLWPSHKVQCVTVRGNGEGQFSQELELRILRPTIGLFIHFLPLAGGHTRHCCGRLGAGKAPYAEGWVNKLLGRCFSTLEFPSKSPAPRLHTSPLHSVAATHGNARSRVVLKVMAPAKFRLSMA